MLKVSGDRILIPKKWPAEPVEVVQVNGERVRGVVAGFDTYSILLKTENGNACFIFKHGISAIHGGNALLKAARRMACDFLNRRRLGPITDPYVSWLVIASGPAIANAHH